MKSPWYAVGAVGLVLLVPITGCSPGRDGATPDSPPVTTRPSAAAGWTRLPDPPLAPRDHAVVVGVGRRMLVVGGWEFLCPPGADCMTPDERLRDGAVYDRVSGSWTAIPPAPFGITSREQGTAVVGDSAFLLAGCTDGSDCRARDRLLEYDVGEGRWTDHGAVPSRAGALLAVRGNVLAYSGSDERGGAQDVVFDPATGEWDGLSDDPLPRVYDRTMAVTGAHLVVAGSSMRDLNAGEDSTKHAARLDLRTGRWRRLPDAGQGYQLFASDRGPVLNGHFIEASGWLLDPTSWTWSQLPDLPGGDNDLRGVLDRDRATYEIPNSVGEMSADFALHVLDSSTGEYVRIPPLAAREGVYDDSSGALGRDLFVYGGQRWEGSAADTIGRGELVGDAWLWIAPEPGVRGSP